MRKGILKLTSRFLENLLGLPEHVRIYDIYVDEERELLCLKLYGNWDKLDEVMEGQHLVWVEYDPIKDAETGPLSLLNKPLGELLTKLVRE